MDAVCGDSWQAIISENNNDVLATWAVPYKKKYGFKIIAQPLLTPFCTPYIRFFEGQKYSSAVSHEQQCLETLIEKLPSFSSFHLYFSPVLKSHLPFHWKGFTQSSRYTYIIENIADNEKVFEGFDSSLRSQIRKAEKNITITESDDIDAFYQVNSLSFKRQGKKPAYTLAYVKRIDEACGKNNCRKILFAKDAEGNIQAAAYLVWDGQCAYYLMGGADEKYKSSGAYTLLLWEAIRFSSAESRSFNFCGSMISSIERFFRSFGGEQKAYYDVIKENSKALRLRRILK